MQCTAYGSCAWLQRCGSRGRVFLAIEWAVSGDALRETTQSIFLPLALAIFSSPDVHDVAGLYNALGLSTHPRSKEVCGSGHVESAFPAGAHGQSRWNAWSSPRLSLTVWQKRVFQSGDCGGLGGMGDESDRFRNGDVAMRARWTATAASVNLSLMCVCQCCKSRTRQQRKTPARSVIAQQAHKTQFSFPEHGRDSIRLPKFIVLRRQSFALT
ncbi:hypothetical protein IWX49DRAFT_91485 [Phyllosticta citricarpa]